MLKFEQKKIIYYIMFITTIIYIFWRLFFTLPLNFGAFSLILGILFICIEIWDAIDFFIHFINILLSEETRNKNTDTKPFIKNLKYPNIDILIATYNEDISLLEKTINGCLNLDYPDKKKLHIYICDDGNRPEIKKLAKEMNINYITRTTRENAKAGNYNNALKKIKSKYVVTLDADMIPMNDFLITTIKYFFNNEKIGFVQTPQCFYNSDIFQKRLNLSQKIPFEQNFFYHNLQLSKNNINAAIYCGTNTIFLRKALDDVNGFATGTISEDIATGMLIENMGYKCIAIDDIKASGYCVDNLSGFIKQRTRWARGCIQILKKYNIFSCKGLNIRQKLEYLSCISYWFFGIKRLIYLIIPILFSVFNIVVIDCSIITFLLIWLPMYILKRFILDILFENKRSATWNKIYETILSPILAFYVLIELIGFKKTTFDVSPKNNNDKDLKEKLILLSSHSSLLLLNLFALIISVQKIIATNLSIYYILLIWLISNIFYLIIAIIFDIGKKNKSYDNFGVQLENKCILINNANNEFITKTKKMSEHKILITSKNNFNINDSFNSYVLNNNIKVYFNVIIEKKYDYNKNNKNKKDYEYILKILNLNMENKLLLYQILYNKQPLKLDFYYKKAIFDIFL